MLSYKHGYHAGNEADVFKHICLLQAFRSLKRHHNSISYIDTHSGSGVYKFNSEYMMKNKEFETGIAKLNDSKSENLSIRYYLNILKKINNSENLLFYPGSPTIMSHVTDNRDKLSFFELHNNEFKLLRRNLSKKTNAKAFNKDGFDFINNNININEKTLALIDPSYEIKDDFIKVVNTLEKIDNEYENLTAIFWYPIIKIEQNDLFIENIRKIGSDNITRIELPLKKYNEEVGMKGSGILLYNGNNFLIKNIKELIKELYKIFKDQDCNIKPKVQKL